MKLICDCGNEEEFRLPPDEEDRFDVEDSTHYDTKHHSFDLASAHDELFIGCNKCGKSIHIWA